MGCGVSNVANGGMEDGRVRRQHADRSRECFRLFDCPVYTCKFLNGGDVVLAGGRGGALKLFSSTGSLLFNVAAHSGFVLSTAVSPTGDCFLTTSNDNTARLYRLNPNLSPGEGSAPHLATVLEGHTHKVYSCSFSPCGNSVLTSSMDKTLRIWDVETGKLISELLGHTDSVFACAYSPTTDTLIASGGDDEILRLWDARTATAEAACTAPKKTIWSVRISRDERKVLSSGMDGGAGVWEVEADGDAFSTVFVGSSAPTHQALFSPDESHVIACGRDNCIRTWQSDGTRVDCQRGHTGAVFCIDVTETDIVSSSVDQTVRIWDLPRVSREGLAIDCFDCEFEEKEVDDDPWGADPPLKSHLND